MVSYYNHSKLKSFFSHSIGTDSSSQCSLPLSCFACTNSDSPFFQNHICSNYRCIVCPNLSGFSYITSHCNHISYPVDHSLHCLSTGVIYALHCRRCGKQYIGQIGRTFRHRFTSHHYNFPSTTKSLYVHFMKYHASVLHSGCENYSSRTYSRHTTTITKRDILD